MTDSSRASRLSHLAPHVQRAVQASAGPAFGGPLRPGSPRPRLRAAPRPATAPHVALALQRSAPASPGALAPAQAFAARAPGPAPHVARAIQAATGAGCGAGVAAPSLQARPAPAGPPGGVAQPRMVLIGNDSSDYATMKMIYSIRQHKGAGEVRVNGDPGTRPLGSAEHLYIVAHGFAGGIWEAGGSGALVDLQGLATKIAAVIPKSWKGEVRVLSCYSGTAGKGSAAVAQQLSEALKPRVPNVKVVGTQGFSYGTPSSAKTGLASVLRPSFTDFYRRTSTQQMVDLFTQFKMTDGSGRVVMTPTKRRSDSRSGAPKIPASAKEAAEKWSTIRGQIEAGLKERIALASQGGTLSVDETLAALALDDEWKALLKEQEIEHRSYALFELEGEGYRTF